MADEGLMEKITSLAKRRGFVYPGSEIYGGFAGTYDYGHYGTFLRRNVINAWRKHMQMKENISFIDSSIFTSPRVWEASGHTSGFNDPLVACNNCHSKLRADHLLEGVGVRADEKMSGEEINKIFDDNRKKVACPVCGQKDFGEVVQKSMLATSTLGKFDEEDEEVYLRGETAQGIFINFKNIYDTGSHKVPFGIGQIGKAFRNEISPRQFLFRLREFEQMEMQYFVYPKDAEKIYKEWKKDRMQYYLDLGISKEHLRWKQHDNLVFYAKDAWDIEYTFPFGWGELEGVHNRGDYDLKQHQKHSGVDLSIFDQERNEQYVPYIIETSVGVDRTVFALLTEAYEEEYVEGEKRTVLHFKPEIAPVKIAVFPLLKNKEKLVEKAREICESLKRQFLYVEWDDHSNVGKRYRRQDEIGTPYCVTVDFDSLEDDSVTVRDRDTMEQERIKIDELSAYFEERLSLE